MLKLDRQFGLYVIREPLAVGETKASCRAEDPFFDREVVLKLVTPSAVGSRENLNRLDQYLESISGLEHPAIAPIYDNGIEADTCYFTTAFYAGGSLTDQLTKPMNIGKGLRIILQLSNALAYAYNEGFEHGKLSIKDIFFTNDGHAVISDFGIAATTKALRHNPGQVSSLAPQDLRAETLQSLAEILIKLLLGPGAKPDAVSTALLKQSHSEPVFNLAADLLGESEREIGSFEDLLERLTDLAVLDSEVGINEYVEYVEQTHASPAGGNLEVLKPALTPSQRQLEIKEAVYAKGEIRRLVAEKTKLQEILRRAVAYKKQTELKLATGAAALQAAQQTQTSNANKLKLPTLQTAGPRQAHGHPGVWMLSGLLVGSLLTSGYNHLRQTTLQEQLQAQNSPPQTTPLLTVAPEPLTTMVNRPEDTEPRLAAGATPAQTEAKHWWPVGGEFDTTAAVPVALVADALQSNTGLLQIPKINLTFPATAHAEPTQIESDRWWAAGNEFDQAAEQGFQGLADNNNQEVLRVVQDWARAWSNQDQDGYFSCYSDVYRPELGRTLQEWRSMRLSRLTTPQWIKVVVHDLQLRSVDKDRVQVKLKQSYSSSHYQDQILKSLNLVKENGKWRISMERSLGPANDMIGG